MYSILYINVLSICIYILYTVSISMCSYLHQCICAYDEFRCPNLRPSFHDATRMQHGKFCYLHRFDALNTLTVVICQQIAGEVLAQVCHDMRRNPDEISCRMKLNSDVPNQGPEWTMGDGYPWELDIPDHCISLE